VDGDGGGGGGEFLKKGNEKPTWRSPEGSAKARASGRIHARTFAWRFGLAGFLLHSPRLPDYKIRRNSSRRENSPIEPGGLGFQCCTPEVSREHGHCQPVLRLRWRPAHPCPFSPIRQACLAPPSRRVRPPFNKERFETDPRTCNTLLHLPQFDASKKGGSLFLNESRSDTALLEPPTLWWKFGKVC